MKIFDVRRVIGGLFTVYGVVVTLIGLFDSKSEIEKAQGVRINLWMGLGMLALGLSMLLWLRLRPAEAGPAEAGPVEEKSPVEKPAVERSDERESD